MPRIKLFGMLSAGLLLFGFAGGGCPAGGLFGENSNANVNSNDNDNDNDDGFNDNDDDNDDLNSNGGDDDNDNDDNGNDNDNENGDNQNDNDDNSNDNGGGGGNGDAAAGQTKYNDACASCHSLGSFDPSGLAGDLKDTGDDLVADLGSLDAGMSGLTLSAQEIADLKAFFAAAP